MTTNPSLSIRALSDDDRRWVARHSADLFGGDVVISRGRSHHPQDLPGFVAIERTRPIGLATYHFHQQNCEIVTLDALEQCRGIGTALLNAVEAAARAACCRRIWLITTNDNLDALRFYQRRGYVLTAVYPNAIEHSRTLKPSIPATGNYGIIIRDELGLTKTLRDD